MVSPLLIDLRVRVATALEQGETVRAAVQRFDISVASTVRTGQRQCSGRGQVAGKICGVPRAALASESGDWRLARLSEKPDLPMRALTKELAAPSVHVAHGTS